MTYHSKAEAPVRVIDPRAGARQDHHRAVLSRVTQAGMSGLGATAVKRATKTWRPMHYQTVGSGFPRADFPYRIPGQLGQTTTPAATDAALRPPPVQDSGLSTGLKVGWGAVAVLAVGLFWFTANPPKSITGNARRRRRSAGGHHVPPVRTLSDDYLAHLLSRRDTLMKGDAAKLEREKKRRTRVAGTRRKLKSNAKPGWIWYGLAEYANDEGHKIRLWRKEGGQKCQWRDLDGNDFGPPQANVAPALGWAHTNGYHDLALSHIKPRRRS